MPTIDFHRKEAGRAGMNRAPPSPIAVEQARPSPRSEIDERVGRNLRIRRQELRWSRSQVGRILGVTKQQVAKYESGQTRLSPERLLILVSAFDVSHSYFFEDRRSAPGADSSIGNQHDVTRAEQHRDEQIFDLYRQLRSDDDKQFAVSFLKWLVSRGK